MARSWAKTNFVLCGWNPLKSFSWLILIIFRVIFSLNLTNLSEKLSEEPNRHTGKWTRLNIRLTWPPLTRNFGEKCTSSFVVGTRLSIRLTYPLWRENRLVWRKFKKVWQGTLMRTRTIPCSWNPPKHSPNVSIFGEKYARFFAVGTRQRVLIKFFSLNSVVFLRRKKINEWSESLIALMTQKFSRLSFRLSKNINELSEQLVTLIVWRFSRLFFSLKRVNKREINEKSKETTGTVNLRKK